MECKQKKNGGITLIALVITILILVILVGVTIATLKNTNLFNNALKAKKKSDYAAAKEAMELKLSAINTEYEMNGNGEEKLKYTAERLEPKKDGDIDYVKAEYEEEASIQGLKKGQKITKIYTKLKKYKYVFEINNNIQIASIDGKSVNELAEDMPYDETYKTGQISDTEYKINGETLNFKKIIKVGESSEYKTIKQGLDYLCDNNYKENVAIVLESGTYATKDIHTGYSYTINTKYNEMEISIIADSPGNVFITPGEMGMGQNGSQYGIKLNFYRVIFIEPINSDAGNNGFHLNDDKYTNKYFNCVFNASPGGYNGIISDSNAEIYNCIFLKGVNTYYNNYPIKGLKQDCASTTSDIPPKNATEITCLKKVNIDSNYNITSEGWKNTGTGTNPDGTKANIGVYGGKYAWNNINVYTQGNDIIIDDSIAFEKTRKIKYMIGKKSEDEVIKNGTSVSGKKISNLSNGSYTIVITTDSGKTIIKNINIESSTIKSKYKINNETLEFERIVYVGENEECTTLRQAMDKLKDSGHDTGAIVLKSGTYTFADINTSNSSNIDLKFNKMNISIIADAPGEVFVSPSEMMMCENGTQYGITLKFYRVVFKNVYEYFHLNGDNEVKEYYNCVFQTPYGGYNGNVNNTKVNMENCLFNTDVSGYYSYSVSGEVVNCASTNGYMASPNVTKTTCLNNISIDSDYNITSEGWKNAGTGTNPDGTKANIGVYGGKYSW